MWPEAAGPAGQGCSQVAQQSSAGEAVAVAAAAAPVQLLKGGTTPPCGMNARADCGSTGSCAVFKGAFARSQLR